MFKKTIPIIGLAAFVALLLAGAANPASAAIFAEKAFNRDGSVKTVLDQALEGDLITIDPSFAQALYVAPLVTSGTAINDEQLVVTGTSPDLYDALFDIFVYDVNNTGGDNPSLFKNDLVSIAANQAVEPDDVTFGIANLRFTWYAGAFDVLDGTGSGLTDLDFSLAAASNMPGGTPFFDFSNRLTGSCGPDVCLTPGSATLVATWGITDAFGVFSNPNGSVFFNWLFDGPATLLVTGDIIEPGGGGYVNIITATTIPLPPAALLFGTALLGIGALRRWKDKKEMAVAA